MFYFSLSLSLWGVITSAQQRSVVRTLSPVHDDQQQLRLKAQVILRHKVAGSHFRGRSKSFAELNMLYVWQCPLMLMSYGWGTLLVGLTLHVCSPLISHHGRNERKVYTTTFSTTRRSFIDPLSGCHILSCHRRRFILQLYLVLRLGVLETEVDE